MKFRKPLPVILAGVLLVFAVLVSRYETGIEQTEFTADEVSPAPASIRPESDADRIVHQLYRKQQSGQFVTVRGQVVRLLADDTEGDRHQRFIIELDSGQTLLISHNIDLAQRIDNLEISDRVTLQGEYEWNDKGGVIHWTHHDPDNRNAGGWIEHEGKRYR